MYSQVKMLIIFTSTAGFIGNGGEVADSSWRSHDKQS